MRKFLIPLLMASAAFPAAASAEDGDFVRGIRSHGERSAQQDGSPDDRPQRAQRVERSRGDGPRVERSSDDAPRIERSSDDAPGVHVDRAQRPERLERRIRQVETSEPVQQVETSEPVQQVETSEPVQEVQTTAPVEVRRSERRDDVSRGDRDGFSGLRDRIVENGDRTGSRRHRWSTDWRRDHRYDWRSYRHRYGSLFRLGRYYDPYGWGYRRWSIGFSLWPSYYSNRFWLNDPWRYRLPYAPPGYRWIRYYDDALLVDTWTGQVVDVIHSFFW